MTLPHNQHTSTFVPLQTQQNKVYIEWSDMIEDRGLCVYKHNNTL